MIKEIKRSGIVMRLAFIVARLKDEIPEKYCILGFFIIKYSY